MWRRLKQFFSRGKTVLASQKEVDLDSEIVALRAEALATYERLQAGSLRSLDTLEFGELRLPKQADHLERLYRKPEEFGASFGGFAKAYAPFRIFKDDEVIMESGADWGYSVLAMRSHGCLAKIISVEAAPFHRQALDRLVELEDGRYHWLNAALGRENGELSLFTPVVNQRPIGGLTSAGATLTSEAIQHVTSFAEKYVRLPDELGRHHFDFRVFPFSVGAWRIPDALEQLAISPTSVAAIKLDIEGHEGPVVAGAYDFLEMQKPMVMNEGANRDVEVRDVMSALGYQHYELHDQNLVPMPQVSSALDGYWLHPSRVDSYKNRGLSIN